MLKPIVLFYLLMLVYANSQVSYEYRFDRIDTSSTYLEELSSSTNPQININGTNLPPLVTPIGLMYGDDAASEIDTSPYLPMTKPFTVTFWVYLFRTDQEAYLISRYQSSGSYIGLKIKNGKLVTVSKDGAPATTETVSSSMFDIGWNTISLSHHTTSFVMRGMPRFGSLNVETFAEQGVGTSNEVSIGGSVQGSNAVESLSGIINRMWYYGGQISDATFQSLYSFSSSCSIICDSLVSIQYDMTSFLSSLYFKNQMEEYEPYNVNLKASSASTTFNSDGMILRSASGEWLLTDSYYIASDRSTTIESWFKGSCVTGNIILIRGDQSGNIYNIFFITKESNGNIVFKYGDQLWLHVYSGVVTGWSSTEWTFMSISIGWTTNNGNIGVCLYLKQINGFTFDECMYNIDDQGYLRDLSKPIYMRLWRDCNGVLAQANVYYGYLKVGSLFDQTTPDMYPNRKLYPCHDTDYLEEPHCISEGCGNGIINSTIDTTTEECDDGNSDDNDGCSSTCEIEDLYECSTSEAIDISSCSLVCGDGELDTSVGEECDDGGTSNSDGCSSTCQVEGGYVCTDTEGATSSCSPECGDGKKIAGETCDDGDTDGDSGCNADCSAFVTGWTCSNGDNNSPDDCTSTCGDGIKTTDEECDDNDLSNSDGCDSNCNIEAGWACSQVLHVQSSCYISCGNSVTDGDDECDDGNSIDNDGCKNNCTIEEGWKCTKDILGSSVCFPKCGDGEVDEGEECDDENTSDSDGCSMSCQLESGYSVSSDGKVLIAPTVSLVSISKQNLITVEFSQSMAQFDINALEDALTVSIEGPMSSYSFTYSAEFTSSTQMELQLTLNKQIVGRKEETCIVKFSTTLFKSTEGASLANDSVSGYIYQKQVAAEAIEQGGAATSNILGFTMGIIILSNVLLGDEIELLWGFMNTLQIITYFPFLNLYLPQFLSDFIESLSIANLQISIGFIDNAVEDFQDYWISNDDYDLATEDETYEENGINSMSVIRNAAAMITILTQGLIICMLAYAIKAKFITVQDEISKRLGQSYNEIIKKFSNVDNVKEQRGVKKWLKDKIIDVCDGYKYHFFIRLGFQLYLEAILLILLNLSVFKFSNWALYVSYCVSIILLILLALVSFCVYKFNKNNFKKISEGKINDSHPFSILYFEYKTNHAMYLQYHTFFMLRRVGYAFCIVFLKNWPFYQNCGVVLLFISKWSYQVVFRPYKNTTFNVIMTINESTLTAIGCLFYLYVKPSTNTDMTDTTGWAILYSIAFIIILNILVLWTIKIMKWSKSIASLIHSCKQNKFKIERLDTSNSASLARSNQPQK